MSMIVASNLEWNLPVGRYPKAATGLLHTCWAIQPEKMVEILSFLSMRGEGVTPPWLQAYRDRAADIEAASERQIQKHGKTGIIRVFGTLVRHGDMFSEMSGAVSTDRVASQLHQAVNDDGIKNILMYINSPGGSVFGIEELAAEIRAAKAQKKVVAYADPIAASAAYWLASQAHEVVVAPSGQVGSIGVLAIHTDQSGLEEQSGVKTTIITSAPFKAELDPSQPLSEDARTNLQQQVNDYHGRFIRDIARGRGITENAVEKNFGGGRMLLSGPAKARGMVDRVETLGTALARLNPKSPAVASARADQVELDFQQRTAV